MILTAQQEKAIQIMTERFDLKEKMTVIAGYAGTGKSTIISHFIENRNMMNRTKFVTYTGKASLVLQNKGLPATTIHRLIYNVYEDKVTKKIRFVLKRKLETQVDLIVIDEVSMVPMNLLVDLASFNIPMIAIGDPGQLEPIGDDNRLLQSPQIFLDEIHRQAQDSPIIRLSMLAREGQPLPIITDNDSVKVISKESLEPGMYLWADQVLCGRNVTRQSINRFFRENKGIDSTFPVKDDKLICLHNYWDTLNEDLFPLINGTIGIANRCDEMTNHRSNQKICYLTFTSDYNNSPYHTLPLASYIFTGKPYEPPKRGHYQTEYEFDFGYAITVHKSQGSEFDNVLVYEECLRKESHAKWLYTAITRASKKLIIVKND